MTMSINTWLGDGRPKRLCIPPSCARRFSEGLTGSVVEMDADLLDLSFGLFTVARASMTSLRRHTISR